MSGEGSNSGSVSAVPPHSPTRASAQNSHSTVTMWLLNTGRFTNTAAAATRGDLRRCKEGLGSREWEKKCVCSCSWLAERQEYQTANERAPWHLPQEYFSPCLTASAAPQFDIKYAVWLVSSGRKREGLDPSTLYRSIHFSQGRHVGLFEGGSSLTLTSFWRIWSSRYNI